jgi:hypothetical protein
MVQKIRTGQIKTTSEGLTAYSPTWEGSSSNPAIGNGTIEAKYIQIGKVVTVFLTVTMGTTTTYGSGFWTFTLPVTAVGSGKNVGYGIFYCNDQTAASTQYVSAAYAVSSTTMVFDIASGARANIDNDSPFTWASTDVLRGSFTYEAA